MKCVLVQKQCRSNTLSTEATPCKQTVLAAVVLTLIMTPTFLSLELLQKRQKTDSIIEPIEACAPCHEKIASVFLYSTSWTESAGICIRSQQLTLHSALSLTFANTLTAACMCRQRHISLSGWHLLLLNICSTKRGSNSLQNHADTSTAVLSLPSPDTLLLPFSLDSYGPLHLQNLHTTL
jgi:hypothetical protein